MKDLGQSLGFNFFSKVKGRYALKSSKKYESRNLKGIFAIIGGLIIFWGLSVLAYSI